MSGINPKCEYQPTQRCEPCQLNKLVIQTIFISDLTSAGILFFLEVIDAKDNALLEGSQNY